MIKMRKITVYYQMFCVLYQDGISAVSRVHCGPNFTVAQTLGEGATVAWGQDCHGRGVNFGYRKR